MAHTAGRCHSRMSLVFLFSRIYAEKKMVSSIRNLMSVVPLLLADRVSILIGFIRACSLNLTLGCLEKKTFLIFKRKFFFCAENS